MSRRPPPEIEGLYSLKVDNISYNTTLADLRRMFDKYGDIGDIHIPRDKYTRQSKGFGFVRFYSRRDAEHAMDRTDGKFLDGRELRVAMARYERPIDERGGGYRGRGGGGGYRGRSRSRSRSPRRRSRSPRYSRSRSPVDRKRSRSPRHSHSRSASPKDAANGDANGSPARSHSRSRSRSRSRSPSRD